MHKISIIINREYRTQIRQKSFIMITFIAPLVLIILTMIVSYIHHADKYIKSVAIINENKNFSLNLRNTPTIHFHYFNSLKLTNLKSRLKKDIDALLIIPTGHHLHDLEKSIFLYMDKPIETNFFKDLQKIFNQAIRNLKLQKINIDNRILLKNFDTHVKFKEFFLNQGEKIIQTHSSKILVIVGMMYILMMFIIIYGVRVMRSVFEEKNNRIVEIIISSVKPFELMMGKILGTSLVALTQFVLWLLILLIGILLTQVFSISLFNDNNDFFLIKPYRFLKSLKNMNLSFLFSMFCIYFIGGYLLFSSCFAAIGAMIDHESDTQPYSIIGSMILIIGFYGGYLALDHPNSSIVFWCSMNPFTSPITMIGRLYHDINSWEIIASIIILFFSIWGIIFFSSKMYRISILKYGEKSTLRTLIKSWYV